VLDEPTNHLDMESIDALAKAVNEYKGGMVLVSHDMRLISQVAKEIWICDNKRITVYKGNIQNFKMDMRDQMGIKGQQQAQLRGDSSVLKKDSKDVAKTRKQESAPAKEKVEITKKVVAKKEALVPIKDTDDTDDAWGSDDDSSKKDEEVHLSAADLNQVGKGGASGGDEKSSLDNMASVQDTFPKSKPPTSGYVPPHLRNKEGGGATGGYVPPHLRNKEGGGAPAAPRGSYVPPHLRNRQ